MADADRAHHSPAPIANWVSGASLLVVLGMAALLAWHSLTDLDIWFHLRAGQDLLAGGGFPQINTYSFADPNHPWLNHEWLFQVLTAWTAPQSPLSSDAAIGWNTMRFLMILTIVGLLALGDGNGRRLQRGSGALTVALTAAAILAGLFLMWPRFNLRPELLSYVFFILLVRGADSHFRRPAPQSLWRDTSLWRLFAVILLWAQCHGFAAIGPVVILLTIVLRPLERTPSHPGWRPLALWAPVWLGLLALVLTPNLWRGLVFPFRALTQLSAETADLSQTVSELVPLLATRNSLNLTLILFKVSLVWGVVFAVLGWGRISVLRVVLFALAAVAAFNSQRNIGLYGVAFVLLHTSQDGSWPGSWCQRWLKLPRLSARSQLGAVACVAILVAVVVSWWAPLVASNDFYLREGVGRRFGDGSTPATYPRQASIVLNERSPARTFANLDAAAFLLGTTQAPLFVDGRTEAYPKARWAEYAQVRASGPAALNLLRRNDVSAVVLGLSSGAFENLARNLVASNNWHPAAADAGGVLFINTPSQGAQERGDILSSGAETLLINPVTDPTRRADDCLAAADLFQLAGDSAAARRALATGLDARPDHPNLNHNLGNLKLAAGDFSGALPHFQQALSINGRLAGSALNAGVCQLRLQQPEAAVASFQRALGIDAAQVGAWVNLAVAQRSLGQHDAAIEALEKALALQPGNARLQGQLQQWRNTTR